MVQNIFVGESDSVIANIPFQSGVSTDVGFVSDVLALAGGGYIVIYQETGTTDIDGQAGIIKGLLFNSDGTQVGSALRISPNDGAYYSLNMDNALQDGGFVVSWTDADGTETTQRFDANGAAFGSVTHDKIDLIQLAGGAFVGISDNATGTDINYQFYNSDFQPIGTLLTANDTGSASRALDEVTPLANGGFAVLWTTSQNGVSSLSAQVFDSSGAKVGAETQVNTSGADLQIFPHLAALAGGGFAVAWENFNWTNYFGELVLAQTFDANGNKLGGEMQVGATGMYSSGPDVAALADGGFVVAYDEENVTYPYNEHIAMQYFNAGGLKSSGEIDVNSHGLLPLEVTSLKNGNYIVSQWAYSQDYLYNLYAQTFTLHTNVLTGNDSANLMSGTPGADFMFGLGGDDTYVVNNMGDAIYEDPGNGNDTAEASVSYILGAGDVENLILTGTDDINGTGNGLNNSITGNAGNNLIDGGAGADMMVGGAGDDTYFVHNTGDQVVETIGGGNDTVFAYVNFDASGQDIENIFLSGGNNATGNGLDNKISNIYGAGVLDGAGGNDWLDGGPGATKLIGGPGDDTFVVGNASDTIVENPGEGTDTVRASVSYVLEAASEIENLVLTGTDNINGTGNAGDNTITGNAGDNTLDGGGGADTLIGGQGRDTYVVNNAGVVIVENAGEDFDDVVSWISWTLEANVEQLTLAGSDNINATGNSASNWLFGNAGNNILDGKGGSDLMNGWEGGDTYIVDNAGDVVVENADEGTDRVLSSINYTLVDNVEQLVLTGSANIDGTGNDEDNRLTGNAGSNSLTGLEGNDLLDGKGGADVMAGGTGDDTYVVDQAADVVTENTDEGTDTVQSTVSWTLAANFENLTLKGSDDISGTGNALDNILIGNEGNNALYGQAGNDRIDGKAGADTLNGGYGDDTYIVDNAGDVVTEFINRGTDLVKASISYTLVDNVENLTLTGTDNIDCTGNKLANVLIGNSGNNILDGKAGADVMNGGYGNDTYIVDNPGDVVTEFSGRGTDLVKASVSYTLAGNVENLTLTGTGAINGTGNELANVLIGNNGANTLRGLKGDDTLTGGGGADRFVFEHAGSANGIDHITDFVSAQDFLVFAGADYGFTAGHHLSAAEFHSGAAVGTNAQFVYDPVTHTLIFDSNGTGAGGHTAIAIFDNGATPQASDFVFV